MIKYKKLLLACAFLFILHAACYMLHAAPVHAQQSLRTFTIVPPTFEKKLDPGDSAEGIMKVINDSNESLAFTASVHDFVVDDTQGTPNLLSPNSLSKRFSAASWIGVTPDTFAIAPHEKQILNYFIQVPKDARPGGHYAAVVFTPVANIGVKGTGASVQTKAGTLFYLSVNGQINEYSVVSKFFANPFSEYGPVEISTQIKNLGDLHIRPKASISISDMLGRKIGALTLDEHNIFPTAGRDFKNSFGQKIMVGRFKASLLGSYGVGNNLPLIATVYFWVFPWKLALLLVLVIVALGLGVMYWRKRKLIPNKPKVM